jgi:hypothetical protein
MERNELLYHYTTVASFLNIVNGGELWASHIRYLNDTSEQRLAWEHVRTRIADRLQIAEGESRDRLLLFQSLASSPPDLDFFILCFSKDGGDRLSQWRGYGENAGVSIGFDPDELKKRCSSFTTAMSRNQPYPMGWAYLLEARYIEPAGDEQSNQVIDLFIDNPNPTEFESRFSKEEVFSRRICLSSVRLKHNAFREENEWRIALFDVNTNSIRFRSRKSMIVPYVPFDLGRGSPEWPLIKRVVVGPNPHQAETVAAIKKRLDDRVVIEGSSLPFRGW